MPPKLNRRKKVGLALGGGAVLGAAHIGALRALDELDVRIDLVAGTSIGAFIASLYAFGKSWQDLESLARDLNWLDISRLSLTKLGILSNNKLGDLLEEHIGLVDIEDATTTLAIIATDIMSGEKVVFTTGAVAEAVMASTCIPGVFVPVEIGDRLLVDGGIVENVPVAQVREMGAQFTIAVDLNARHARKKPDNIIEILLRSFDFALDTATKEKEQEAADVIIKPDLSRFNMVDVSQAEDLMETGYSETMKVLEPVV